MFNLSSLTEICETTILMYGENSRMPTVFLVEFISSILAIFTTLLTLLAVCFNKTLHFNMRLLLVCLWCAIIITCTGILINSSYYLIAITSKVNFERCAWLSFTKPDCVALRNVYYLGLAMIVTSTFSISVERVIATFFYQTYRRSACRWIGISMASSQWLMIVPLLYYANHDEGRILPYCAFELFTPQEMKSVEIGVAVVQSCSFVITIVLRTRNNTKLLHRKLQDETASVRFQLIENITTSKMLMPLVATITTLILICVLPQLLLLSFQEDNYRIAVNQMITYCFYTELQACFLSIVSINLAIISWYTNETIQSSLFHLFGIECCMKFGRQNSVRIAADKSMHRACFDLQQKLNNPRISRNGTAFNNLQKFSRCQFTTNTVDVEFLQVVTGS